MVLLRQDQVVHQMVQNVPLVMLAITYPVDRVHWTNDVHVQTEIQLLVLFVKIIIKTVILLSTIVLLVTQTFIG